MASTLSPEVLRQFDSGQPLNATRLGLTPEQVLNVLEGKIGPGDSLSRPLVRAVRGLTKTVKQWFDVPYSLK